MSKLPVGWAEAKVSDVTLAYESIDPTKFPVQVFQYIDIGSIDNTTQEICDPKTVVGIEAPSRARRVVKVGDTLFSTVRTYLKNIALVPEYLDNQLTSTGVAVLRPAQGIDARFLFRLACTDDFVKKLSGAQDGTMYPAVSEKDVLSETIWVAPSAEQGRIVDKIDSLTVKSKRARDHLNHIPRLVEKYKQAVLIAAFSGKLTAAWRVTRIFEAPTDLAIQLSLTELAKSENRRLSNTKIEYKLESEPPFLLPTSWRWVKSEAVCGFITKGTTPSSNQMDCGAGDIPFIKVYNLTFSSDLDFTINPTFVSKIVHEKALSRSRVIPGDVLMNIVGPPLGKVSIVPHTFAEWNINQAIAIFRPTKMIESVFLARWLLTKTLLESAVRQSKATAGQSNLTLEICRKLPVPICPIDEQREIVRRIESAFTWIDRLASEATSARKLIDRLDQAILSKAFRGELVPQDPNDEPASVLLERILAERASAPAAKRGRRKQT